MDHDRSLPAPRRDGRVGAIVTAAGPQMREAMHDLALPTFRRYAERWG